MTFEVLKAERVVMTFEDRPGVLQGTATVAGSRPAAHPFVNAQAHDASQEGELGRLIRLAKSVEHLITMLEDGGFRVQPQKDEP